MHYNFVRIHQTLKVSPAMAAGVTSKLGNGRHGESAGRLGAIKMTPLGAAKQLAISTGLYKPARRLYRGLHPLERRLFHAHGYLLGQFVKAGDLAFDVGAISVNEQKYCSLLARLLLR